MISLLKIIPFKLILPPIFKLAPIPTPPETIKAPDVEEVDCVVDETKTLPEEYEILEPVVVH